MDNIFIKGTPVPKGSVTAFPYRRKDGRLGVGITHGKKAKDWEKYLKDELQKHNLPMLEGAVGIDLVFFIPRPKSVKRDKPYVRPDIDKLERCVLDALTGISFKDDGQVVSIKSDKIYADNSDPGVDITIMSV